MLKYIVLYDDCCIDNVEVFDKESEALGFIKDEVDDRETKPEDYSIAVVSEIKKVKVELRLVPVVK